MVQSGWEIVCDYYQNVDTKRWVPYSIQNIEPLIKKDITRSEGAYGSVDFKVFPVVRDKRVSAWHDVPLIYEEGISPSTRYYNFVVEIPMFSTAKMEVMKEQPGNPIMQDSNKDGSPRFYTYGVPFFNYGLLPRTWEDPEHEDPETGAKVSHRQSPFYLNITLSNCI